MSSNMTSCWVWSVSMLKEAVVIPLRQLSPPDQESLDQQALGHIETVSSQQSWLEGEASQAMADAQCLLGDVYKM